MMLHTDGVWLKWFDGRVIRGLLFLFLVGWKIGVESPTTKTTTRKCFDCEIMLTVNAAKSEL
jgi:hypothetical protein